jgi:hypothetical protein
VQAAPPAWSSAKLHAAHRQWCATAPCTTADRTARLWLHRRARWASPPSTAAAPGTLRRRALRIPAADAPAPQCKRGRRVRLSAARVRRSGPAAAPRWPPTASSSVRCAKYVRTGRRSSVSVHTHHRGQDRGAPRHRPEALLGLLLGADNHGLRDRVTVVPARDAPAPVPRGRPCFESPVFPDLPVLGVGGPPLRIRPLRELRARVIWPCPLLFAQAARRPRQIGGKPGRRHIGRHHRVFPRSAAAGCTSRRARCGPARRS